MESARDRQSIETTRVLLPEGLWATCLVFRCKQDHTESHTERMKRRIDSTKGKRIVATLATVEPVFDNLRHNKRLTRFTLLGRTEVDGQWKPYCLVHKLEKLGHHGHAN